VAGPSGSYHDDDAGQPRRRKVPSRANRTPSPKPPARAARAPAPPNTRSHYFANAGPGVSNPSAALARERILSPNGRPPIFVPDSDEDEDENMDWQVAGAREPAVPAANGSSSDFDMGDEDYFNDEAILELADRVEREELAMQSQSQSANSRAGGSALPQTGSSERTVVATASTLRTAVASSGPFPGPSSNPRSGSEGGSTTIRGSSSTRGRTGSSRPETQRSAGAEVIASEVITIEDSDTDDKENIPAPTRHVRRRVNRPLPSQDPGDIIELSD